MTTPTTAEVGHGNKQEQIMSCTGSPRRAAIYEVQAISNRHGVRGWRRNGVTVASYDAATAERRLALISMI